MSLIACSSAFSCYLYVGPLKLISFSYLFSYFPSLSFCSTFWDFFFQFFFLVFLPSLGLLSRVSAARLWVMFLNSLSLLALTFKQSDSSMNSQFRRLLSEVSEDFTGSSQQAQWLLGCLRSVNASQRGGNAVIFPFGGERGMGTV